MSIVLGIASSHDASACLYRDGKLLAAISEERISRLKCDGGHLPNLAIDACLKMAGLVRTDVDHIATNYGHFPERYLKRASLVKNIERSLSRLWKDVSGTGSETQVSANSILKQLRDDAALQGRRFEEFFHTKQFLAGEGFRPGTPVYFFDHHASHAIAAAFFSGFTEAAVITMDGEGDLDMHHGSYVFKNGAIERKHVSETVGCSPGYFYMAITELLGFRPLRHEGKVLGLAAFGDASNLAAPFRRALRLSADGHRFDSDFAGQERAYGQREAFLRAAITGHKREDVAAAAQQVFEAAIVALVQNFMRETGQKKLAVNGGVFANVKLNQRIAALPEVEQLFVFPGMSDTGNSVGAALMVQEQLHPGFIKGGSHVLDTVYWGPDPSRDEIKAELARRGLRYEEAGIDAVTGKAAQAIHAGQVVGWSAGFRARWNLARAHSATARWWLRRPTARSTTGLTSAWSAASSCRSRHPLWPSTPMRYSRTSSRAVTRPSS